MKDKDMDYPATKAEIKAIGKVKVRGVKVDIYSKKKAREKDWFQKSKKKTKPQKQ